MARQPTSKVTEERLERALQTMAVVIDHYGDAYWPVFEALKRVLDEKRARRRELAKYRPQSNARPSEGYSNVRDIRPPSRASR
jgi:hypothetical protein